VDLDCAEPTVLAAMRHNGHEPCAVIETSPVHLQAWVRVSVSPLPPGLATSISRRLASLYQGDRASADWRHIGRLAGFTNQKPQRRLPSGLSPWVKVRYATAGLATDSPLLVESVVLEGTPRRTISRVPPDKRIVQRAAPPVFQLAQFGRATVGWLEYDYMFLTAPIHSHKGSVAGLLSNSGGHWA
jgi:hypothetical protein